MAQGIDFFGRAVVELIPEGIVLLGDVKTPAHDTRVKTGAGESCGSLRKEGTFRAGFSPAEFGKNFCEEGLASFLFFVKKAALELVEASSDAAYLFWPAGGACNPIRKGGGAGPEGPVFGNERLVSKEAEC